MGTTSGAAILKLISNATLVSLLHVRSSQHLRREPRAHLLVEVLTDAKDTGAEGECECECEDILSGNRQGACWVAKVLQPKVIY